MILAIIVGNRRVFPATRNSFADHIFYTFDHGTFRPIAAGIAPAGLPRFGIICALVLIHHRIQMGILKCMNLITRLLAVVSEMHCRCGNEKWK
jgi:hypothetical protein